MIDLSELKVGVAGLGLIGGSLAGALSGSVKKISAWDMDPTALERGLEKGFDFHPCKDPGELVDLCDVLIIAVPLRHMEETGRLLKKHFRKKPLAVMDVGSSKKSVGEVYSSIWGSSYVGLHPMAGKEYSGIEYASSDLFFNARCAVVPGELSDDRAVHIAKKLVRAIGSEPVFLEAGEHDRIVGCASHLPITLATAMSYLAGEELEKHPDLCSMVAGGFRDTTRLGSGPPWLLADMWETNGKNLDELLGKLIQILEDYRKSSPRELEKMAEKARQSRESILAKSDHS
jgi:prephenate dehydrogenase